MPLVCCPAPMRRCPARTPPPALRSPARMRWVCAFIIRAVFLSGKYLVGAQALERRYPACRKHGPRQTPVRGLREVAPKQAAKLAMAMASAGPGGLTALQQSTECRDISEQNLGPAFPAGGVGPGSAACIRVANRE